MRFAQKNALITGAADCPGRHIAQAFAAEGADIAILDFQDAGATVREITALKRRCEFFLSDVHDEDGVGTTVARAAEFFGGRIDLLVNHAGFNGHYSLTKDMPLTHWRQTIETNLTGTMLITRTVLPFMLDRKTGSIVTTASNVVRRDLPYRADYVCSKWAILGLTRMLALEVGDPLSLRLGCERNDRSSHQRHRRIRSNWVRRQACFTRVSTGFDLTRVLRRAATRRTEPS